MGARESSSVENKKKKRQMTAVWTTIELVLGAIGILLVVLGALLGSNWEEQIDKKFQEVCSKPFIIIMNLSLSIFQSVWTGSHHHCPLIILVDIFYRKYINHIYQSQKKYNLIKPIIFYNQLYFCYVYKYFIKPGAGGGLVGNDPD